MQILICYTFIASLLCREGKQGIKSKAGAKKSCKEIKISAPPNAWLNIQLSFHASTFARHIKLKRMKLICNSLYFAAQWGRFEYFALAQLSQKNLR